MRGTKATIFIGVGLASVVLAAPAARAATSLDVSTTFADPVTAGTSGNPASISMTNDSTGGQAAGAVTIDNVFVDPACDDVTATVPCPTPQPNTITLSAGVGAAGTTCAGTTWIYGPTNVAGAMGFNRQGGNQQLLINQTCLINFTFTALRVPTVDAQGDDGVQTNQNLNVQADHATDFGPVNFINNDYTTINPAPPATPTPIVSIPSPILPPTPTKTCKKGQKLKKGKCVKKKRKKK